MLQIPVSLSRSVCKMAFFIASLFCNRRKHVDPEETHGPKDMEMHDTPEVPCDEPDEPHVLPVIYEYPDLGDITDGLEEEEGEEQEMVFIAPSALKIKDPKKKKPFHKRSCGDLRLAFSEHLLFLSLCHIDDVE